MAKTGGLRLARRGQVAVFLPAVTAAVPTVVFVLRPLLISAIVLAAIGGTVAAGEPGQVGHTSPAAGIQSLCSGSGWQERRGLEALESLGGNPSEFHVAFLPERPRYYGMTRSRSRTIEVYVRPCDEQSREMLRHVLAHELGHAHDRTRLDDRARSAWLRARGIRPGTSWYGCNECPDFDTPAGDYAEAYGQWLRAAATNRSTIAPPPDKHALPALADTFFTR